MNTRAIALLLLALALSVPVVHASALDWFVPDSVESGVQRSLESIEIVFYEFVAIVLDLMTVLLFCLWIVLIAGIVYGIYYLMTIPKRFGVRSFHDAAVKVGTGLWGFMK